MMCANCEAPDRRLFAPGRKPAALEIVHRGEWIDLERCPACGALWCFSPYEPYAAFEYYIRWEFSAAQWREWHEADAGQTLRRWHAAVIREQWLALAPAERDQVDQHRRRSYGHNPIDNPAVFGAAASDELLPPRRPAGPGKP